MCLVNTNITVMYIVNAVFGKGEGAYILTAHYHFNIMVLPRISNACSLAKVYLGRDDVGPTSGYYNMHARLQHVEY